MFRFFSSILITATLLTALVACSIEVEVTPDKNVLWTLSKPVSFDLHIPPHLFRGQLERFPGEEICHTQGMEIVGDEIIISCCLYNARQKTQQSFAAESFLIKASLSAILKAEKKQPIHWMTKKITEIVPDQEQEHVTRAILNRLPVTLAMFIEWFFPLGEITHVMGHPSGLIFDEKRGGLWVANSVYGQDTYTHVHLFDPRSLTPLPGHPPIALRDHLGFVATSKENLLWGINWGNAPKMILIDPKTRQTRIGQRPVAASVGYQDCDRLDPKTILCGGYQNHPDSWYPHRTGVIDAFESSGSRLKDLRVRHKGILSWVSTRTGKHSSQFGIRSFVSIEQLGDIEISESNTYGDYKTPRPLTNAGMAISPDQKYVYFLPDDVPGGKLIQMQLHPKSRESALVGTD